MSTFAFSANVVAIIEAKNAGAKYCIDFDKPPKNGECWVIGSAPYANVSIGHQTQGISGKHLGIDFGQDGMVVIKVFSSHDTSLAYQSVSDDEKVDSMVHECIGKDSPRAPAWAVPVGQRVHICLGHYQQHLELTIQAFDHSQHLNDYLEAIKRLKASAPKLVEPTQPQPNKGPASCPPPPPPTPAPGVATFMSRALGGMEIECLRCQPHVITFFGGFIAPFGINKRHMLLTQWCELGSMVEQGERKSFTYHESCMVVEQIAKVLMYLHGQRVVHRDVRPRHILVRSRTTSHLDVCLTDFSSSTQIPTITGATTATYASNEHYSLRGQRRAEDEAYIAPDAFASSDHLREEHVRNLAAVDIWSLGVIALELLTGSLPTIVYETAQDMQHPILVSGQQFTKALVDHRDKMAKTPAAAANGDIVPLIMEMLQPSPYCRITAQELAAGMVIVVTLMGDESRMKYYRTKYPGGQFPGVAAPRIHAYDLWRGVS